MSWFSNQPILLNIYCKSGLDDIKSCLVVEIKQESKQKEKLAEGREWE